MATVSAKPIRVVVQQHAEVVVKQIERAETRLVGTDLHLGTRDDPKLAHFTYLRFLENRFRENYPFTGTPIRLVLKPRR